MYYFFNVKYIFFKKVNLAIKDIFYITMNVYHYAQLAII